jgi:hypothetical protein
MLKDGKDGCIEFHEFLIENVRDPLTLSDKKPPEEQTRPSKRIRLQNTTPDPQEQAYANNVKEVTFALTGESRNYLVGLRDTAL